MITFEFCPGLPERKATSSFPGIKRSKLVIAGAAQEPKKKARVLEFFFIGREMEININVKVRI